MTPMSSGKLSPRPSDAQIHGSAPVRPVFHHQNTQDRIREGSGRPPPFFMVSKVRKDRKSVFRELGLDDPDQAQTLASPSLTSRPGPEYRVDQPNTKQSSVRNRSETTSHYPQPALDARDSDPSASSSSARRWYSRLGTARRPKIQAASSAPPATFSGLSRMTTTAILIAVVLPAFSYYNGRSQVALSGADAGVIRTPEPVHRPVIAPRDDSPTQICTRWSHQSALLNGTLYIYGGQVKTYLDQATNTWNNYFLTLDLTRSWDVSSPSLSGLPKPSGPPAVANGYLWNDYSNLFLYGGEFADNPYADVASVATWKYSVSGKTWTRYDSPQTSAGNNTDGGGVPVQRAAEGAGLSVPELGLSWYFGGHLDLATTPGWSNQIARVYLKTLLEFTHPGYGNDGVYSLSGVGAGEAGVYRNISQGGLLNDQGFSERADGALVFVPGWGEKGVLIGLAGGNAAQLTNDLSTLDVYDIASSTWFHQQTSGTPPPVRVNPCAVIASAPDASSFQIYLFGGQDLQPPENQTQYNDMYILSIPSFTWVQVTQGGSNQPSARAGHTCNLRDGQIVVVGGFVGKTAPCDSPGIYVFNATSLEWQSSFHAISPSPELHPDNSVLAASYGYRVPQRVAEVIGGNADGGATASTPAVGSPTAGPFATGKPPVFTITASGATATVTQWGPGVTSASGSNGAGTTSDTTTSARPGLISAGIIAALAGLAAAYLGYCAWLYRRQVRAYKTHLAVANRYSGAGASKSSFGGLAAFFGRKGSNNSRHGESAAARRERLSGEKRGAAHRRDGSSSTMADSFAWVGREGLVEPKMLFDDSTPGSGSGSSAWNRPSPGYTGPYGAEHYGYQWQVASQSSRPPGSLSGGSSSSTENLLEGQEPSFFSVVLGPRRALRVVNGLEEDRGENLERR